MSFPWTTEAQRRKRADDEDFARRAVAELQITMAEILRRQSQVNVLRPAPRPRDGELENFRVRHF